MCIIKCYFVLSTLLNLQFRLFPSDFPQCQISSVFFLYQEMGSLELFKVCEEMKLCNHSTSLRIKAGEMQCCVMCLSPVI